MMAKVSVLEVLLYGEPIGTLTRVEGDRSLFAFNEEYIADQNRPVLGLGFKDKFGELLTEFRPYQTRIMPFFSNLLPEERLREYLAERAGVNPEREFFLLWVLGNDLPGAVTVRPADAEEWPSEAGQSLDEEAVRERKEKALRFSLAGVQLKFSALEGADGGLTIPAKGVGGSWIVKLPSEKYDGVPENEFSMMTLARKIGMNVPALELVDVADIGGLPEDVGAMRGQALAIERFDRLTDGSSVHIEDFAQIFGIYPKDKHKKASMVNIANVVAAESDDADIREFIRRLVFNTLIGNADMHIKNWSVYYPDKRIARLAPAYDFLSTIPYIADSGSALSVSRTKRFDSFDEEELVHLAGRVELAKALVLDTARETVELFHRYWAEEKNNLPLYPDVVSTIDKHLGTVPLA
ncbi:type II toxin-antitoxin system HipA family toxin [Seongchinamella sediminis]|uniref:Type II toxin-antitoxin system HipA family toxin n=1 Tax=Seongchinamella sediminis TaxID=2283635 RepID=A0A3L7E2L4_9GAMM|nr:type II toxin-antitoxin system HipA family toxin [Seongchinamella sediminis]